MSFKFYKVKQNFKEQKISDIKSKVLSEIKKINLELKDGSSVAIAVGSRGINNIKLIVKTLIDFLKDLGVKPFIVPAMGSHGGATAQGQLEVLESLGISEKILNVPIKSSMEVVELDKGDLANRVFMDKFAYESDGIILVNRIKPHTDYHGDYESGLVKMSVVGLGKHEQAKEIHSFGLKGLTDYLPKTASKIFNSGKILAGLGIVEDAYDNTAEIFVSCAKDILKDGPKFLDLSKKNMPSLPVEEIDALIIGKIGKNISGTGMDPNITGRIRIRGVEEPKIPNIKSIVVTDISDESHGNAVGIGFADVITKRAYNKINYQATYENVITSTFLERAKVPLVADDMESALKIALRSACPTPEGLVITGDERIIYIKDTLHLGEIYVSPKIYFEIKENVELIETVLSCELYKF